MGREDAGRNRRNYDFERCLGPSFAHTHACTFVDRVYAPLSVSRKRFSEVIIIMSYHLIGTDSSLSTKTLRVTLQTRASSNQGTPITNAQRNGADGEEEKK